VVDELLAGGGRIAVPGGQGAFDVFLNLGFSAFHLSRVPGVALPGGRGLFSVCEWGRSAETALAAGGLKPDEAQILDAVAGVTLTVWRAAL
jgi:hypothetical protein